MNDLHEWWRYSLQLKRWEIKKSVFSKDKHDVTSVVKEV